MTREACWAVLLLLNENDDNNNNTLLTIDLDDA
jgi:hypothetical protein